ncbi:hypothetical protein ACLH6Q_000709 [Campylobacter fetus]|uniref:hypothetical protein n=1 Tax=Campylobacter fetus TaxID=196 RepID=UPI001301015B|nr:hypothetical protein [Campylobacter fetus]EDO9690151.1 hypothetical protein [Campylobacter fetus]EGL1352463.1 hypothetical protein [Campylobacter fetus]EKJ0129038.1 hypothetical protein [Campylobacter fetus]EKJ0130600.1 hypothetical protein [Campylobacter fetus]EKJ0567274.1 hypothetical protein [Campylobacter fetus]
MNTFSLSSSIWVSAAKLSFSRLFAQKYILKCALSPNADKGVNPLKLRYRPA